MKRTFWFRLVGENFDIRIDDAFAEGLTTNEVLAVIQGFLLFNGHHHPAGVKGYAEWKKEMEATGFVFASARLPMAFPGGFH